MAASGAATILTWLCPATTTCSTLLLMSVALALLTRPTCQQPNLPFAANCTTKEARPFAIAAPYPVVTSKTVANSSQHEAGPLVTFNSTTKSLTALLSLWLLFRVLSAMLAHLMAIFTLLPASNPSPTLETRHMAIFALTLPMVTETVATAT